MANRIYIQIHGTDTIFDLPLIEDIQFETTSNFQTWGEIAPILGTAADIVTKISAGAGQIRSSMLSVINMFDLPRWSKTEPIKFTTKLAFYTKDNPKTDVFNKMSYLMSLSMLTKNSDGTYTVPGVGARNIGEMLGQASDKGVRSLYKQVQDPTKVNKKSIPLKSDFEHKSKLITIEIPGVIYLNYAFITVCTPVISKQKTESGFPLWGTLDVTISGLFPASDQIFTNTEVAISMGGFSQESIQAQKLYGFQG